jgi:hypothetical protein
MALVANKCDLEPKREVETEVVFKSSSHTSPLLFPNKYVSVSMSYVFYISGADMFGSDVHIGICGSNYIVALQQIPLPFYFSL